MAFCYGSRSRLLQMSTILGYISESRRRNWNPPSSLEAVSRECAWRDSPARNVQSVERNGPRATDGLTSKNYAKSGGTRVIWQQIIALGPVFCRMRSSHMRPFTIWPNSTPSLITTPHTHSPQAPAVLFFTGSPNILSSSSAHNAAKQ